MEKERNVIEENVIVVFDGDVDSSALNELFQDFKGGIVINGALYLDKEGLIIQCDNLYVMGKIDISAMGANDISLVGNLYVEQSINCTDINVNGSIYCMDTMDSFNINVSEDLYVNGKIDTRGYDIFVGGDIICENRVDAAEITVLGKLRVSSEIYADSISVG